MQGHVAENCNYQKFCANCNINGHSTFQCRNSRPQRQKLVRQEPVEEYVAATPVQNSLAQETEQSNDNGEMKDVKVQAPTNNNNQKKQQFVEVVKTAVKKEANMLKKRKQATRSRIRQLEQEKPQVYSNMKRPQRRGRSHSESDKNKKKAQQRLESLAPSEARYIEKEEPWNEALPTQTPPPSIPTQISLIPSVERLPQRNGRLDREQPSIDVQDQDLIQRTVEKQMVGLEQKIMKEVNQKLKIAHQELIEQMKNMISTMITTTITNAMQLNNKELMAQFKTIIQSSK